LRLRPKVSIWLLVSYQTSVVGAWSVTDLALLISELSTLLAVVAITFGGNLATETFSLGGEDDRTYSSSGIGAKAFGR
jgi:hypothetical protein